ncbi:MAG: NAD(P)-dependent oxidoreductase [Hyphomicrobiales bacterium]|nr:MAG: NAD(P)-dependent oxidoreductase [Hyphomicrobiales bacterium]
MATVGMIGLGIMGGAMARNLVAAGFTVIGFDVSAEACTRARGDGVTIAANVAEAARSAPHVLTSLPSPKAVLAVAREIADAGVPQRIVAETSTLALADKEAFAEILRADGHVPLDCPLSGTGAQAQTRDLVVFASGDAAAIAALDPVFAGFSRKVQVLGAFGDGTKMKFVANLLVAINNVASAEAMVLGMKAGLDPSQIIECVTTGAANSRIFELRAPMMAKDAYLPATMKLDIWKKDMAVIGAFAAGLDCPVPLFSASNTYYDAAIANGRGPEDAAAVCTVLADMAGLTRR